MLKRNNVRYVFDLDSGKKIDVSSKVKISVVNNLNDFKTFFKIPWLVYKDDENWVAPLWQEMKSFFKFKNPFWKHAHSRLFIAYKDGVAVGRIATVIDKLFTEKEKKEVGLFGFFECIEDYSIASALFDVAKDWLKNKGMSEMWGPMDARVDVRCGFLFEGSKETPYIFGSYNPYYYVDFVERYDMKKCRDQLVYYLDLSPPIPQYLKDAAEKVEKMGVKIRGFKRLRARSELRWWMPLLMKTFSFHWGYVDVTEEEIKTRFGVKQIRWIADPGLFLVAESPDGEPIAFKWTTPDFNQAIKKLNGKLGLLGILKFLYYTKKIDRGRLNVVGIKKEWQGKSIGSAMNYWTMLEMKKRNYSGAECGWIDEKNIASQRTIEKTGAKLYKKYRVYQIKI
jgi:hypothetical protein